MQQWRPFAVSRICQIGRGIERPSFDGKQCRLEVGDTSFQGLDGFGHGILHGG
jgi:hypothetical protein